MCQDNTTGVSYEASIECEVCHSDVPFTVSDTSETTSAHCPDCNTYYPELYI